ncbi:DUF2818 family protein [Curvibacter sp. CHRR-16]|uniref:DUF2818 family protein n=1 Tax=Curvibacter sp. CHRR-16 TaxID=2835872 RepID=UPI001BDAEA88|nr:DUF2818 family protein [Curvibacter sp. CHRR-16]MBT0571460.1 DUF2818 family protein [Curvibacter sp. CHRR-16]
MQSFQSLLIWVLILAALVAANIFLVLPVRLLPAWAQVRASFFRWMGWFAGYAIVLALGMTFERYLGQNASQGWVFWAATWFVYAAFSFPGFVYRYLWRP